MENTDKKEVESIALQGMWNYLHMSYFPNYELKDYRILWSNRNQKRTLASCNVKRKIVRVAHELRYKEHEKWLSPLLYHEMCHAVMAEELEKNKVDLRKTKVRWHGVDFKTLENRHPQCKEFQDWIKKGGWLTAVRSSRKKDWWQKVKAKN